MSADRERFREACESVAEEHRRNGIGTLSEKTVHAVLKNYFSSYDGSHERKLGRFVADVVGEDGIIEIQTRSFSKLGRKLEEFLRYCPVTVVYPCAAVKHIVRYDPVSGSRLSSRKSPVHADRYSVFIELEGITKYLAHPNFRLCIMLMEIDELRCPKEQAPHGQRKKRRRDALALYDSIPRELIDEIHIESPADWKGFLPAAAADSFTTADLAAAGMDIGTARLVMNVFRKAGFAEVIGKKGNAFIYTMRI